LPHPALQPAPRLLRKVLEVKGAHGALQSDVKLGDLSFADRQQNHAMEREQLVLARHVFLIARQAVEAFGHDGVELSFPGVLQERLIARPQVRGAASCAVIRIDALKRPALRFEPPAADPDLVLDRGVTLKVRRISGVDHGAHVVRPVG